MYLYMHVTRLLFYGVLGVAAWFGEIPWWVVPAWILWDSRVQMTIKIPFTTPKKPTLEQKLDQYPFPYYKQNTDTGNGGIGAE